MDGKEVGNMDKQSPKQGLRAFVDIFLRSRDYTASQMFYLPVSVMRSLRL